MARPTPFETKRKKAPLGALGRIQCLNVAEGTERLKTLLEVATEIYSEIGECKEVLFNTRAYA